MGAKTLCLSRLSKGVMLKLPSIKEGKDRAMVLTSPRDSACASLERSLSFKNWGVESTTPKSSSFKFQSLNMDHNSPVGSFPSPKSPSRLLQSISPRSPVEQDAAAVKLQSVYKGYRTRRNLADCAVVAEELWWKTFDRMVLNRSSITFFDGKKEETVAGRWMRARKRAAKVGKGLSKDEKAQKLALQHWLEAIDPRHRYGHNLHIYYNVWFETESTQPFFYWLDLGDGKELSLHKCPRSKLQHQCIKYLEPKEREAYEVIVADGLLVYKQSRSLVDTVEGSKWIFVLSTSKNLYVGQKKKGEFQHSSFLSGAATTAAGRLVAKDGVLEAIWPYSGHYLPTEENFKEFISFLVDNNVDLTNVKRRSVDDDDYSSVDNQSNDKDGNELAARSSISKADEAMESSSTLDDNKRKIADQTEVPIYEPSKRLPCNWTSGVGPRIMCVRDYPVDLQSKALEQVNLSPRVVMSPIANRVPIPSPRPSPRVRLSPRLAYMGIPSPRVSLTLPPRMKH